MDQLVKIFRYLPGHGRNPTQPPIDLNYKTGLSGALVPERTFIQGELQRVDWHADENLDDLIIRADMIYARDQIGFAEERTTTRTWYLEDGTAHPDVKVTKKLYRLEPQLQEREAKVRRGNIIDRLFVAVTAHLVFEEQDVMAGIALGQAFLQTHKNAIDLFVSASLTDVYFVVQAAVEDWMGSTFTVAGVEQEVSPGVPLTTRDFILAEINIWGL